KILSVRRSGLSEGPCWGGESGAAARGFASRGPVFLLVIFGMIAYAIYFGAAHSVQQIAADAARTSVAGLDEAERNTLVAAYIDRNADGYLLIDEDRLTVSVGDKADDASQYQVS